MSIIPFEGFSFEGFWDDNDYSLKAYVGEPATDEQIRKTEEELGYKLPQSYKHLIKLHNGGTPVNTCFPASGHTGWAEDHAAITGIYGISREKTYSIFDQELYTGDWGYPEIGLAIADTPTAGHTMIFLDYRECGPQGEPKVVTIDQECGYIITLLADNFEQFIRGLEHEDDYPID